LRISASAGAFENVGEAMTLLILLAAVIVLIVGFSILTSYEEAKSWEQLHRQRTRQAHKGIDTRPFGT
jgi:hypothetical protein